MATNHDIKDRIGSLPNWLKYKPTDLHYIKFPSNILASLHKAGDVLNTYCHARSALLFAHQKEYNNLIGSDTPEGLIFIRSHFLQNSMILYNICVDLSWQVVWLWHENEKLNFLDKKILNDSLQGCKLDILLYDLTLMKEFKIRNYMRERFQSKLWVDSREKYNYFKHRGAFHIPNLGVNPSKVMFDVNGYQSNCFQKREFNLEEWSENLIEFNSKRPTRRWIKKE